MIINFIPAGGQIEANSIEGQGLNVTSSEKTKNSIISEQINNKNPNFKPFLQLVYDNPNKCLLLNVCKP